MTEPQKQRVVETEVRMAPDGNPASFQIPWPDGMQVSADGRIDFPNGTMVDLTTVVTEDVYGVPDGPCTYCGKEHEARRERVPCELTHAGEWPPTPHVDCLDFKTVPVEEAWNYRRDLFGRGGQVGEAVLQTPEIPVPFGPCWFGLMHREDPPGECRIVRTWTIYLPELDHFTPLFDVAFPTPAHHLAFEKPAVDAVFAYCASKGIHLDAMRWEQA